MTPAEEAILNLRAALEAYDQPAILVRANDLSLLIEELDKAVDALQAIYWGGCSPRVEEIILAVLTPEQRLAWARAGRGRPERAVPHAG